MDLSMILMAVSALGQIGTGIYQAVEGNEASKEERPIYDMPEEVNQALNVAKNQAYGNMPGYELAKSNIEQAGASQWSRARESASSGSDLLGFLAAQGVGQNRSMNQLAAQNQSYQSTMQQRLQQMLLNKAGWKDKEFQYNQAQPYAESQTAANVLTEGGIQNIFGGLSGAASNYMSYKQTSDLMNLLYGNKKQPASTLDIFGLTGGGNNISATPNITSGNKQSLTGGNLFTGDNSVGGIDWLSMALMNPTYLSGKPTF